MSSFAQMPCGRCWYDQQVHEDIHLYQWWGLKTCLVSRLSRNMVFHVSVLAHVVSTLVSLVLALSQVSMSRVLCVSLTTVSWLYLWPGLLAKCLFYVETLAFLAESRHTIN